MFVEMYQASMARQARRVYVVFKSLQPQQAHAM
jgi:hypothetical protein